ncbi:MAG: J domain-containing protein [Verrucomicrobia bacterium]|nr:J domain-containing protein [Verrucomicrobiota bacterium]
MSGEPNLHPDIQRLTEENDLLREELTRLLTEADDLVNITKPHLLAQYQSKVGGWELKRLKAQCEAARLKRQIELVQAALNRGARPDLVAIERQLEKEFVEWQAKVAEAARQVAAAENYLKHLMSPEDDREFRKLYYALVKKLHPDPNPNLTENRKRLWHRVQSAYESGDLVELRALALLVEKEGPVAAAPGSLEKLQRDQATLQKQINEMLKRIERIESQPPLTLRKQLADEAWVAARRREMEEQTAAFQAQGVALAGQLRILLGRKENDDGKLFGPN